MHLSSTFNREQHDSLVRLFRDTYDEFLYNVEEKSGNRRLRLNGMDFYLIQGAKNFGPNGDAHHAIVHRHSDGAYVVLEGEMGKGNFRGVSAAFLPEGDPMQHAQALIRELQRNIDILHENNPDMMEEGELNPHRVRDFLLSLTDELDDEEVRKTTDLYIRPFETARNSAPHPQRPGPA